VSDEERAARVEEIRKFWGGADAGQNVPFLLAELDRVRAERDEAQRACSQRLVERNGLNGDMERTEAERDAALARAKKAEAERARWRNDDNRALERDRDAALAQVKQLREALDEVRPHCEQCGVPATRLFRTEGDGNYWLCGSTDPDHGEEFYSGEEVPMPKLAALDAAEPKP
jgi:hypothetical protein